MTSRRIRVVIFTTSLLRGGEYMIIKIWDMYYEDSYSTKLIAERLKVSEAYVISVLGLD